MVKAYAENPLGDSITTPSLTRVDGQQVVADSPLGVEGAIRTMIIVREALRRAGRPGMPIVNAVATAVRSQEHIAGHHFGIRTTDALEIFLKKCYGYSIEAGGSSRGTSVDYTSPVEPLFCSEVAHAVAGMSRKEANRITIALLEKYEDKLRTPSVGKKYQECCDVVTGVPNKEFIELYREVRQEMTDQFGLKFQRSSPYL